MIKRCLFCDLEFKTWHSKSRFCSRKCSTENYKKRFSGTNSPHYGVKKTTLARERIRLAKLGNKNPMFGKPAWNKGLPWSEKVKQKVSQTKKDLLAKGVIKTWNKGIKTGQKVWNKGLNSQSSSKLADLIKKARKTRLEHLKDPVYRAKHTEKLSESHKEYYRKHPEALLQLKEIRSRIIYPKKDSKIEVKLQGALQKAGINFTKHYPFYNKECETRIDVVLPDNKIAIYCDGDYWHNLPSYKIRDEKINAVLAKEGWTVLRFWEHEINSDIDNCVNRILVAIKND